MSVVQHNINLKPFHTFGFNSMAQHFVEIGHEDDILALVRDGIFDKMPFFVLGGGSNVMFKSNVGGLVVHPTIKGIKRVSTTTDAVLIEVGAGEDWDGFVSYCVDNGFYGIENLSLIPGNIGASPVQNIGAYGAEANQCIESVRAIDVTNGQILILSKADCRFGYRDSVFKHELKNRTIITSVVFKLSLIPAFNLDYGPVKQAVELLGGPTLHNVRRAIVEIRQSKLPDPLKMGNAGSFFKNPVVPQQQAQQIKQQHPAMPEYGADGGMVKIPAGWLIEAAGWKGKQLGRAGVHANQALVLVNLGDATCEEVLALADAIEADVLAKFGVKLEKEVNVVG